MILCNIMPVFSIIKNKFCIIQILMILNMFVSHKICVFMSSKVDVLYNPYLDDYHMYLPKLDASYHPFGCFVYLSGLMCSVHEHTKSLQLRLS